MLRRVSAILSAFLLILPAAAAAHVYNCSVNDPTGDTNDSPGLGFRGQPFQDIVRTSIIRTDTTLAFSMDVAAPLPEAATMKNPHGLLLWMWGMNTGSTFPLGYPIAKGNAGLLEFWVHLMWDGTGWGAQVIDRRPTVTGGDPVVTAVPYTISGATITITAPAALFDDPDHFRWGSTTWTWSAHLGTDGAHSVDRAPDDHVTDCTAS